MTETLSIRLPREDKQRLFTLAKKRGRSVNELVRQALGRDLFEESAASPWQDLFGSVNVEVPAPTNANVRRAMLTRKGA